LSDTNDRYFWKYIYDVVICHITEEILLAEQDCKKKIAEKVFHALALSYYNRLNKAKSDSTSRDLMILMTRLQYKSAFTGKDAFRLINENIPKRNVFVCADEEAEKIWKEYADLKRQVFSDVYRKNSILKNHRKKMAQYVISVTDRAEAENEGYSLIDRSLLLSEYNLETGYISKPGRPPAAVSF
jgi:CRISPR-associated endonuclease/helicase Cas3